MGAYEQTLKVLGKLESLVQAAGGQIAPDADRVPVERLAALALVVANIGTTAAEFAGIAAAATRAFSTCASSIFSRSIRRPAR